ncbi:MAG: murein biosynthesis integral membrane protein MurJ [Alphaproteobacteria bacterium]
MSFFKSVFLTSGLTLLSRILAFFRDQVLAFYLGTSQLADSFFLAFRLPNILRSMFAEGAFQSAFVPILSRLGFQTQRGLAFINRILIFLFSITVALVVLAEIFMPNLLRLFAPTFADDTFADAVFLARWMFPYLILISLVTFSVSILQVQKRFFLAGLAQVIFNAGFISLIFVFVSFTENPAIAAAYAVLSAGIIQLFFYTIFVRRSLQIQKPLFKMTQTVRVFFQKFGPGVFGSGIYYVNMIVNTIFASLFTGGLSILHYATRLFQLPIGVFGIAFNSVLLPHLSETLKHQPQKATKLFGRSILVLLWLGLPAMSILFFRAEEIIYLLFEHGAFDSEATLRVSSMLKILSLGILPALLAGIFSTLFYARGDTKTPAKLSLFFFLINVGALFLFTHLFGLLGLGFAITLNGWVRFLTLFGVWIRKYKLYPSFALKETCFVLILNLLFALGLLFILPTPAQWKMIILDLITFGFVYIFISFILRLFRLLKEPLP